MNFRQRLILFLCAALIGVQALMAVSIYGVVRRHAMDQGQRELTAASAAFLRQLNVLSERIGAEVTVLSYDYGLRSAIAEQDRFTALSALRNHGGRIGADRMLLVDLNGRVTVDTVEPGLADRDFPFPALLDRAAVQGTGTALTALAGEIYWIVVVPVMAPVPIAFIAAGVPVGAGLLDQLRSLSATPHSLTLATVGAEGEWRTVSQSGAGLPAPSVPAGFRPEDGMAVREQDGYLIVTAPLDVAENSAPVIATLNYPLDEALAVYRDLIVPMLLVLAVGLLAALGGALLIARGVSRPLETLAGVARRIAGGDYTPIETARRDEIGALSRALNNMARSVAEREAALMEAMSSLEMARKDAISANEAKSQFLSNMSHELRTPLNAVIGFSEMLLAGLFGPLNQRQAEYAKDIHESGKRLLVQVDEMLHLAEAAEGKMVLAKALVSSADLAAAVLDELHPIASQAQVRLVPPPSWDAWPTVEADPQKLRQCLKNVLHNAIRFTPEGGTVTVEGESEGQFFHIRIADTGVGMDPEDVERATVPFHRRRKAFDGTHQGAGIGLPYAKTILELHGGALTVESTKGRGTVVTLALPVVTSIGQAA